MNPVIDDMMATRHTFCPDGTRVELHSNVRPSAGCLLGDMVEAVRPSTACEVGLAFGVSTLYILDAISRCGSGRLIGMDPDQHGSTWRGAGLHAVERAGLSEFYEFHSEPSQVVLPKLAAAGTRLQFAFLDGWHTFDHTLVDFFFIDRMLDIGGVVILDDVGYPGLRRLGHFIVTNRSYEVVATEPRALANGARRQTKSALQRLLGPLVRDDLSPTAEAVGLEKNVDQAQLIALRKMSHDCRPYDHFIPF